MARSTNPNYTWTVAELCLSAARELGAVGISDTLDSTEEAEMIKRLNSMLAKWSKDANLWRQASGTVSISGGVGAGTLPAEVHDIRSARHVITATNKRPLVQWNRDQYFTLPDRAQVGDPTAYYFARGLAGVQLYIWPVPAAAVTIEIDYARPLYFAESNAQELDIPFEWHEAALYGLASRSAGLFGTITINPQAVQRCDAQARSSYERMLDADRPDSYFFEYDSPVEVR